MFLFLVYRTYYHAGWNDELWPTEEKNSKEGDHKKIREKHTHLANQVIANRVDHNFRRVCLI